MTAAESAREPKLVERARREHTVEVAVQLFCGDERIDAGFDAIRKGPELRGEGFEVGKGGPLWKPRHSAIGCDP